MIQHFYAPKKIEQGFAAEFDQAARSHEASCCRMAMQRRGLHAFIPAVFRALGLANSARARGQRSARASSLAAINEQGAASRDGDKFTKASELVQHDCIILLAAARFEWNDL
jgi:hypothetical protein